MADGYNSRTTRAHATAAGTGELTQQGFSELVRQPLVTPRLKLSLPAEAGPRADPTNKQRLPVLPPADRRTAR